MNNWFYKGIEIDSIDKLPEGSHGFIYLIRNEKTGKFYIGKKNFYSERNIKLGKKALEARDDKRASKKKKVIKESDWKSYFGSETTLKEDIKLHGDNNFHREILCICNHKKALTYQEIRYQILYECLESDNSYNDNISGKFFRKDIK